MSVPFILIDGSSYFFRAFHALPPLTTSKGQPTGAIYGVVNMIKRLIKDYNPEYITVIFDAKGKTFRDDWYPAYKAHRPATPHELSSQFEPLNAILKAMGLPILTIEGVEADDVIGTLALMAIQAGQQVLISTSDKDMAQLVNEKVALINTMTNHRLDIERVKEKFGVYPEQIIDYLTLIGDTVDNIPGVMKCGPKTAAKWLEEYKNLEDLCANAHHIGGKVGENLRASLPHLPLSKRLITIKTDVELPVTLDELKKGLSDRETLINLTKEFEFKNWLNELLQEQDATPRVTAATTYQIITEEQPLHASVTLLTKSTYFSFSIESTNTDPLEAEMVGIALASPEEIPVYIPLQLSGLEGSLSLSQVLAALKPVFENPEIKKLSKNVKRDYHLLKKYDITLRGVIFDTMLASYVLNSTATQHTLESLALKYLGQRILAAEDIQGKGVKQLSMQDIALETIAPYAAENAAVILKLFLTLSSLLPEASKSVLEAIELPLAFILADMEQAGVLIDEETLYIHGQRLKQRIEALETHAFELATKAFNLNSPKQLQEILYEELKLPVLAKTPKGQPSTAESVLQDLSYQYTLPGIILEYRGLTKLVSTYIDALPKRISPRTKRVHTCYNQAVAATGRLSSSEPNLQNIPIRSEEGRLIRKAFIAPPGKLILAADYSQIELRIMAHLSQDPNLLKAFVNNWDIHTATASEIFQVDLQVVTSEQRRRAKAVNFGLIYGMSAFGLSKQLGIERHDAEYYIERYFTRYPGVLEYMERTRCFAHLHTYVETLLGRRLYLPEINTKNQMRRKAAERMAINAPMQGTAADIIKKAMLAIASWQQELSPGTVLMMMQVHDELLFEVAESAISEVKQKIQDLMENAVTLSIPLQVTLGVGKNWDEAH